MADTQFERGNYNEAIDSYKSFARLHPTHEKVEDGYVAFRICECYFKDMPDDVWILPPSYEKDQSAVHRRPARAERLRQEVPRLDRTWSKAREHPPGGAAAAGRPRGLRGALLSGRAITPRRPSMRLEGAHQALPGIGARARAAAVAGRDLPAHGRSAAGQGDLRSAWSPSTHGAPGAAVRAVSGVHQAPLRSEARRRSAAGAAAMDDADRAGLRELVARGREHYAGRRVRQGRAVVSPRCCARQAPLRRRLRHAGRHLSPGGAAGGGRGRCSTRRCASTRRTPRRR